MRVERAERELAARLAVAHAASFSAPCAGCPEVAGMAAELDEPVVCAECGVSWGPFVLCSACLGPAVVGGAVGSWCVGCAETLAADARSAEASAASAAVREVAAAAPWSGCHVCGLDAVWAVPWGDAFCALHGAGRPDVVWRGGGLSLRDVVVEHPEVVAAGWSWPDVDAPGRGCPGCGEEYDASRGGGPLYQFDDSVEYPLFWADDADVVSCVCCDTYFVRRGGRLFLTWQV